MAVRWTWKYPKEVRLGDLFRGRRVTWTVQQEDGRWAIVLDDGEQVLVRDADEMLRVVPTDRV